MDNAEFEKKFNFNMIILLIAGLICTIMMFDLMSLPNPNSYDYLTIPIKERVIPDKLRDFEINIGNSYHSYIENVIFLCSCVTVFIQIIDISNLIQKDL